MIKGSIPIIILLLILMSSAVIGVFVFYGRNSINSTSQLSPASSQAPTQKSPEPTDEKVNWKTYTNVSAGYSLKYPEDARVVEAKPGDPQKECCASVLLENESQKATFLPGEFQVTVLSNPNQLTLEQWSKERFVFKRVTGERISQVVGDTTLGGKPAKKALLFEFDRHVTAIATFHNGNFYEIRFDEINPNDPELEKHKKMYSQMLTTFKFTEKMQLDASEKARIDIWIEENNLNQYGDPKDTAYTGGTPLFDEATGETKDRYEYILEKHPDRPWNK